MDYCRWLDSFTFPLPLAAWIDEALREASSYWELIDQRVFVNQQRVLEAMQQERIGEEDFQDSSGYGDNDRGREKLESIYARVFETEAALVRNQIVSGTHALAMALFGLLRPGDEILFVTGAPYDTLQVVVGSKGAEVGTLKEWGIGYRYLPLTGEGEPDISKLSPDCKPRAVYIQRSIGYEVGRRALTIPQLEKIIGTLRQLLPKALVLVDNCYGEFVETKEPTAIGADLAVGSLIKNPGGGLAGSGGYLAGKGGDHPKVSSRLTARPIDNLGPWLSKRSLFQGLFGPEPGEQRSEKCCLCRRAFRKNGLPGETPL